MFTQYIELKVLRDDRQSKWVAHDERVAHYTWKRPIDKKHVDKM